MRRLLLLVLLCATSARAEGANPYLQQAKAAYMQVKYEKCIERARKAADEASSVEESAEIDLYAGLCHFNLGASDDAAAHFRSALKRDRTAQLPPYSPPKAVSFFRSVAKQLPPEDESIPEASPTEDRVEERAPPPKLDAPLRRKLTPAPRETARAVTVDAAPFPTRTVALSAVSLVIAGVATGIFVHAHSVAELANQEPYAEPAAALAERARTMQTVALVGYGAAGATALSALLVYLIAEKPPEPHPSGSR